MPTRKSKANKSPTPQQTTFIEPQPQVKNGDILDVDEAAILLKVSRKTIYNRVKAGTLPHARVGRKLLFSRQKLQQWIALGGDLAGTIVGNESSSLEQMLNNGQARVIPKR
jgi:excisionase family DNA binding protein